MSNAAHDTGNRPHGVASLPDDLSEEQLAAVPVAAGVHNDRVRVVAGILSWRSVA